MEHKPNSPTHRTLRRSFTLLQVEMVLTKTLLAMAIMTPFFYSIGMNQAQIGLSQAFFTVALLLLNIPTGWLADRFSRKWCNIGGDALIIGALAFYSTANSFGDVVIAEIIFGVGAAFSQGADAGLQKAFCKLFAFGDSKREDELIRSSNSIVGGLQFCLQALFVIAGGVIGAADMRLAILLSAVPYVVGLVCILCMKEVGEKAPSHHRNPFKDMALALHLAHRDKKLRSTITAYAVGREVTHVMVWGATPIALLAGIPAVLIGLAWALNSLAGLGGTLLARRYGRQLAPWLQFASFSVVALLAMCILSIHLSLATIWLYAAMGFGQGWSGVVLGSLVGQYTPAHRMSIVSSAAATLAQLLYVPLVIVIGWVGSFDIRFTMMAIVVIFCPIVALTAQNLRRNLSR